MARFLYPLLYFFAKFRYIRYEISRNDMTISQNTKVIFCWEISYREIYRIHPMVNITKTRWKNQA
jgi:hypothetical protein